MRMNGGRPAPLACIRVLDINGGAGVSFAAGVLGSLGADVVTVCPADLAGGGGAARGRGCGILLDLSSPAGHDIASRLAAASDVLVEGLPAGFMDRLGLDPATLAARNPRLIYCSMSRLEAGRSYDGGVIGIVAALQEDHDLAGRTQGVETGLLDSLVMLGPGAWRPAAAVAAWPSPLPGRHTDEVIEDWLGCGPADIERFRGEGAFG